MKDTLKTVGLTISFLMLVASCSQHGEEPVANIIGKGEAISFVASMKTDDEARTRADNEIGTSNPLTDHSFGVFASYTGLHKYSDSNVSPDFMYNEQVSYNNQDGWNYSPLRYWPNGEGEDASLPRYVSFFAYAPFGSACISDVSNAHESGDPWITYKLAANIADQTDLLYAMKLDQTKQAINQPVKFEFNHALACVGDYVQIGMSQVLETALAGKTLKLTDVSIDYTLTSKAKLVLWNNGTANWQAINSENATTTRSVTLLSGASVVIDQNTPWTDSNHGVFYIPLTVGGHVQKADVHIAYDVYDGNTKVDELSKSGTVTLILSNYAAYQPGKELDINITLNNDN